MILTVIIAFLLFFIIVNFSLILLLFKNPYEDSASNICINFSIIIAAKNEEENITSLVRSLKNLDYRAENFEVIIVDDNSSDSTFSVTERLIKDLPNYYLFKAEVKIFPAKKGTLDFGIKKAKYPFILITDADCRPGKDWLKSYTQKFYYEENDFVFGVSPFYRDKNFVSKISCFENLRSSILTFASAITGFPYSASARNFGFKKSSFEKIKGFLNTTETLSGDDDLLLREAVKNKLKIGTIINKGSFVYSSAKQNIKEYFDQKSRHTKASLYYLPGRQLVLGLWHLTNLLFLFSPLFIFLNSYFILFFIIKLLIDLIIVKSLQKKFGYDFKISEIIYLQVVYEVFLIIHFINAIVKKDKWK